MYVGKPEGHLLCGWFVKVLTSCFIGLVVCECSHLAVGLSAAGQS